MVRHITLDYFDAADRCYNLRRIKDSGIKEVHYHDFFQICYVLRGQIEHFHNDKMTPLGPGDAFIIPPGLSHELRFAGDDSDVYSLSFAESIFSPGFPQSGAHKFLMTLQGNPVAASEQPLKLRVSLDSDQRQSVQALMECLMREQNRNRAGEMSAAPSLIASIFYILSQSYYQQPQNEQEYHELTTYTSILNKCTEYLDQHYNEHITLEVLLKQFALSRSSFCTLFPQFTGLSLKQYLSRKRILEAQELIRSRPELPFSVVAELVGYDEISTFYRNFVRVAGVAPSKYKEICGGK